MGNTPLAELRDGSDASISCTQRAIDLWLLRRFQKSSVVVAMVVCVPAILYKVSNRNSAADKKPL